MNNCTFSGRLTRDGELKYTTSGKGVVNFTLAVDYGFGDNKGAAFIDCVKWNGEKLAQYLTKGKPIIVSGELQQDSWTDKDGNKRSKLKLNVHNFDFQQGDKNQNAGQPQAQPQQAPQQNQGFGRQNRVPDEDLGPAFPSEASGFDEIPF